MLIILKIGEVKMSVLVTKKFITDNVELFKRVENVNKSNLFTKVANDNVRARHIDETDYTILNYSKILNDIVSFVEGYLKYKEEGDNRFASKVLDTTINFYDKMFEDKSYRKIIKLHMFSDITEDFTKETAVLQDLFIKCDKLSKSSFDHELEQLIIVTKKQYSKISKVFRDDIKIYLWLVSKGSVIKTPYSVLPGDLMYAFINKSTPVMHENKGD